MGVQSTAYPATANATTATKIGLSKLILNKVKRIPTPSQANGRQRLNFSRKRTVAFFCSSDQFRPSSQPITISRDHRFTAPSANYQIPTRQIPGRQSPRSVVLFQN